MRTNLVLMMICICVIIAFACADDPKPPTTTAPAHPCEEWSLPCSNYENPFKGRCDLIKAECERLGNHEWAGEYRTSMSLGWNPYLALSPASGVGYFSTGCLGVYDFNEGDIVEFKANRFVFKLRYGQGRLAHRSSALHDQMVLVKWGPRRYLVPPQYMRQFCTDEVPFIEKYGNSELTDIPTRYLLRDKGGDQPVTGLPEVPAEFRQYLPEHLRSIEAIPAPGPTKTPRQASPTSQPMEKSVTRSRDADGGSAALTPIGPLQRFDGSIIAASPCLHGKATQEKHTVSSPCTHSVVINEPMRQTISHEAATPLAITFHSCRNDTNGATTILATVESAQPVSIDMESLRLACLTSLRAVSNEAVPTTIQCLPEPMEGVCMLYGASLRDVTESTDTCFAREQCLLAPSVPMDFRVRFYSKDGLRNYPFVIDKHILPLTSNCDFRIMASPDVEYASISNGIASLMNTRVEVKSSLLLITDDTHAPRCLDCESTE